MNNNKTQETSLFPVQGNITSNILQVFWDFTYAWAAQLQQQSMTQY